MHDLSQMVHEAAVIVEAIVLDAEHLARSSSTPVELSPPSVLWNVAMVLRAAWVRFLLSLRSSRRFHHRLDSNSIVFDSWSLSSSSTRLCRRMFLSQ